MKKFTIDVNNKEPIPLLLEKKSTDKIAIFIGGSGDVKDSFKPIASLLADNASYSLSSFSFRGRETGKEYPPEQQINDLKDVLDFMLKSDYKKFTLIPTSMGFISTASILADPKYSMCIEKVLMLDPADYPLDMSRGTWSGNEEFSPNSALYSDKLKSINTPLLVDVIFFGLRNYDKQYKNRSDKERGIDNPNSYPRLNRHMSKNIYENVPAEYRGEFIEDRSLPHAFSRDGDINQNHQIIAKYIKAKIS